MADPPNTPGSEPAPEQKTAEVPVAPEPAIEPALPESKPSRISNGCGNLMLFLILCCLIAIPFLVYFTDTPNRIRSHASKIFTAARGNSETIPREEYQMAISRISELEQELAVTRAAALEAPPAGAPAPARAAEAPSVEGPAIEPDGKRDLVPDLLPRQEYEVSNLSNGLNIKTILELQEGDLASRERVEDNAYQLEVKLNVAVPRPNQTVAELSELNPDLPKILPDLKPMVEAAEVSPLFQHLYEQKHQRLLTAGTRIEAVETRHNYFDCETVLALTHPETKQKVLLMQGEMDVVADGSDGDRMPEIDDYVSLSTYYQPTTSFGWRKTGNKPNPLLDRFQKELKEREAEFAIKGLSAERNDYLRGRIGQLKNLVADLKNRSFLIAEADPFIVLPLSFLNQGGTHAPAIGDYCAVVHEGRIYPAICGDAGPSWKMGEASLFVAQTLNERASPYNRPVSDLHVTYLVFPGSADPTKGPPVLEAWKEKVGGYIQQIGGLGQGYELYDWRNVIAERHAVRELGGMGSSISETVKTAASAAEAVEKALTAAKKKSQDTEARLAEAKSAPAPAAGAASAEAPDLEQLQKEAADAQAKVKQIEEVAVIVKESHQAVQDAVATIQDALKTAQEATAKPLSTPKEQTTDVALAALDKAKDAYAVATSEAQAALEARGEL